MVTLKKPLKGKSVYDLLYFQDTETEHKILKFFEKASRGLAFSSDIDFRPSLEQAILQTAIQEQGSSFIVYRKAAIYTSRIFAGMLSGISPEESGVHEPYLSVARNFFENLKEVPA